MQEEVAARADLTPGPRMRYDNRGRQRVANVPNAQGFRKPELVTIFSDQTLKRNHLFLQNSVCNRVISYAQMCT